MARRRVRRFVRVQSGRTKLAEPSNDRVMRLSVARAEAANSIH